MVLELENLNEQPSCEFMWSSYQGHMGDVSALEGDEGRGSLRKAWGS